MKKIAEKYIVFVILFLWASHLSAQITFDSSIGISIPGKQDLKYRYYQNGVLIKNIKTQRASSTASLIDQIGLAYWFERNGIGVDYLEWEHQSSYIKVISQKLPPLKKIEESRKAFIVKALRSYSWPFNKGILKDKCSSYIGVGAGFTLTEVTPGLKRDRRLCLLAQMGGTYKISSRLLLFTEAKYILAHDADNYPPPGTTDWLVDTSGHPFPLRPGPHLDTRYYSFSLGMRISFF